MAQSVNEVDSLYQRATGLYQNGDYDQSKSIFEGISKTLCIDPNLAEKCIRTKIYLSKLELKNREFDTAEVYLKDAQSIFNDEFESTHPVEIRIYSQAVYLYVDMTKFDWAQAAAEKLLQLADEPEMTGFPRGLAYRAVAYLQDEQGNLEKALDLYSEAVQSVEHLERNREILRLLIFTYNNMGLATNRIGNLSKAMDYFQEALKFTKSLYGDDHPQIGILYNNIGSVYYYMGDFGQAADYFLRTAAIFREKYGEINKSVAGAYNNAGVVYEKLGDLDKATEIYEKAQRIKEKLLGKNHLDTAIGYNNLGSLYQEKKEYDKAFQNFQLSISIRKKIYGPDHPNLIDPYISLGDYYTAIHKYRLARNQFREAERITETRLGENHPDNWSILLDIGNSYEEENNLDEALEYYNRAFRLMMEENEFQFGADFDGRLLSYPMLFLEAAKKIGDVKIKQYEMDEEIENLYDAVEFYGTATEIVDFLQTSYQSEASKLNLLDHNYSIFTNAIKAYYLLYRETDDKSWLDDILHVSELSRSRIALELLQDIEAKEFAGIPDEVLENERALNSKIAETYQKLNTEQEKGFEADEEIISAYRDSLFNSRRDLIRFTKELELNYPDYFQLKYEHDFVDREAVSQLLQDDETLVNYMVGEDELYALVLGQDEISVQTLGSADSLSSQIMSLRNAVISDNKEEYSEVAYALYKKLVEPIMQAVKTSSMIIVPDQMLYYLPFGMLLTEKPEGSDYQNMSFLIREKQISYVSSATVLRVLTVHKSSNPRNLFAIAPFDESAMSPDDQTQNGAARYATDLSPLPLTRYETHEIATLFEQPRSFWDYIFSEDTEILLGHEATESKIKNTSLEEFGFIHFATHAFVNESDPALSGIAFWGDEKEDGIIYVNDIYNMKMKADLVVLSACETGLGTVYKGEGMIGFTRAFIYAGVSNLLVSLWRVNDQPTAQLMIQFYKYARDGYSYRDALRKAKLDLINQPGFADPRNWAAFVLQGR